jgi:uncharacterized protein (TIGR02246 family)
VLFTALSCSKKVSEADLEADKTAIKQVLDQYATAANSGDFDLWISLWADDGVRMPSGASTREGIVQITEEMTPAFEHFVFEINITSVEEVRLFGDIGLTRCSYNLTATPNEGGDKIILEPDGKALTIYERQSDGTWKIIYDCMNSNVTPISE